MSATIDRVTAIYLVSDLFGIDGIPHYHYGTYEPITEFAVVRGFDGRFGIAQWTASGWDRPCHVTATFAAEPTAAEVRELLRREYRGYIGDAVRGREPKWEPITPAEPVALRFKARIRLTPAELLADPVFARGARKAAEAGKQFTAELLEWEKKDVVRAAVAVLAVEVETERAEAARVLAETQAAARAKAEAEAPVREAVSEGYEECGYRECAQGHSYEVVVGDPKKLVGCHCEIRTGDRYSSRVTFRRRYSHHTIWVRKDYLTRVFALGGARCGGMLVLDAECVGATSDGTPVFELRCAKQAAGTGIEERRLLAIVAPQGPFAQMRWAEINKPKYTKMPAAIVPDYVQDKTGCDDAAVVDLRAACGTC